MALVGRPKGNFDFISKTNLEFYYGKNEKESFDKKIYKKNIGFNSTRERIMDYQNKVYFQAIVTAAPICLPFSVISSSFCSRLASTRNPSTSSVPPAKPPATFIEKPTQKHSEAFQSFPTAHSTNVSESP